MLKLQYLGHLIWRAGGLHSRRPWCWERLTARGEGKTEDEMVVWHHWFNGQWVWANSGRQWRTGKPGMLQFMGLQRVGHNLATVKQQTWGSRQWYGKLSKRAQVRSTWKINQQGTFLHTKHQVGLQLSNYSRVAHLGLKSTSSDSQLKVSKMPTPSRNNDSVSSWTPFLLHCHTLFKTVIPERLPWWSRILNKQSAFQCREQGFDPWLWN